MSNTADGARAIEDIAGMKRNSWRKTKQEIIDEKVERLFETYKIMDDVNKKQIEVHGFLDEDNKIKNHNKYFPEDDDWLYINSINHFILLTLLAYTRK